MKERGILLRLTALFPEAGDFFCRGSWNVWIFLKKISTSFTHDVSHLKLRRNREAVQKLRSVVTGIKDLILFFRKPLVIGTYTR